MPAGLGTFYSQKLSWGGWASFADSFTRLGPVLNDGRAVDYAGATPALPVAVMRATRFLGQHSHCDHDQANMQA